MENGKIVTALRNVDLFERFGPLRELVRGCPRVRLEDGEVLFETGSAASSMYVVLDGAIEIYRNRRYIRQVGPNEYVGEVALLDAGARSVSARAVGPTTLLEVSRDRFERHVRSDPETMATVARLIARRLREGNDEAQAAFEQTNTMIHDMLNLVCALTNAELIRSTLPSHHPAQEGVALVLEARDALQEMGRAALEHSRFGNGAYPRPRIDLGRLVRDCIRLDVGVHGDVARTSLRLDLPAALREVQCNPLDIRRVLANLIINAAQATGPGGKVVVRVRQNPDRTTISVRDNGPGIPEDVRPHIFEPHFTTRRGGSCLGLSACRQIIEALHGGRVRCDTELGAGTTFTCELPATMPERAASSAS